MPKCSQWNDNGCTFLIGGELQPLGDLMPYACIALIGWKMISYAENNLKT